VRTDGLVQSDEQAVQPERKVAHPISKPRRARWEATCCLAALIELGSGSQNRPRGWRHYTPSQRGSETTGVYFKMMIDGMPSN
jgi:hypothetical protein